MGFLKSKPKPAEVSPVAAETYRPEWLNQGQQPAPEWFGRNEPQAPPSWFDPSRTGGKILGGIEQIGNAFEQNDAPDGGSSGDEWAGVGDAIDGVAGIINMPRKQPRIRPKARYNNMFNS